MENQTTLTKKEEWDLKKQNKKNDRLRQARGKKIKKYFMSFFAVLVSILVIFGLWKLLQQSSTLTISSSDIIQVQDDDWVKGNASSTVTLIEYLDFECEACRAYQPLVKRILKEYRDEILFVSRYFPLSGHKNGMTSALSVEAAGKQGKYWEMYNLLFEEQENWGEQSFSDYSIFEQYAKSLNLDMEQFKQDVRSREVKARVSRDRKLGRQVNIDSTPTFFLNGKKIQNPRGYEAFKSLIDKALVQ